MAVGGLIRIAGKLLGPGLRGKLGGARGLKQLANDSLMSGAYTGGLTAVGQLATGQFDPVEIAKAALVDTAVGGLASGGVRSLRGTKGVRNNITVDPKTGKKTVNKEVIRGSLETPANVAASFIVTPALLGATGSPQGIEGAQQSQVTQQQVQRATINNDPNVLAGMYLPYTNFLNTNSPSAAAAQRQMLNDIGPAMNDKQFAANAQAILGL
jgi:hypothetical protein